MKVKDLGLRIWRDLALYNARACTMSIMSLVRVGYIFLEHV